jgi:hypothetical protein
MKKSIVSILLWILVPAMYITAQTAEPYHPRGIQMSGDGSRFAIIGRQVETNGDWTFPVEIYDAATYELAISFPLTGLPASFGLNRNGTKLGYIITMFEFGLVDLETMDFLYRESGATSAEYEDFSWSPVDDDMYVYGLGISIQVGDLGRSRGGYFSGDYRVAGIGWTSNGNIIASQYSRDSGATNLGLWDIDSESQTPIKQLGNGFGGTSDIELSLSTGQVAVQNASSVSIFDSNLNWIKDIPTSGVSSFAWSVDGSKLAIATGETLDIWDIEAEEISQSYDINAQHVIWLPNGDLIHDGNEVGFYQNGNFVTEFVVSDEQLE